MKVFLRKDIERVGMAGEIIKVEDGYARNFLIPRNLAIEITAANEASYKNKIKSIHHRKEVIATKTSILAENIKSIKLVLKKKMHDDGKLYGAVSQSEIADLLSGHGITVAKSQIIFDKSIKSKGNFEVTVKLTTALQPKVVVQIIPE